MTIWNVSRNRQVFARENCKILTLNSYNSPDFNSILREWGLKMSDQRKIRKAVFPVAGLGTRFLPATKAMPKEMLTIVDRPVIQIAVDEAKQAGIEHFIFVTGRNKAVIEDHFDKQFELEETLRARGKDAALKKLNEDLPAAGQTSFTRQQEPLGLGHAVWCARELVGDEPFALVLPDMLMKGEPGCLAQMVETYNRHGGNVVAVEEVPHEDVYKYGVVACESDDGDTFKINGMVEKPPVEEAPSNLIISGRYILQPEIFEKIEKQDPGSGWEIQITDAMIALLDEQIFHGTRFKGKTYDCGSKIGFLSANIAYGLAREDMSADLRAALIEIVTDFTGG
jgi:UTP--glucose-1-phosphate uridylyltransferase